MVTDFILHKSDADKTQEIKDLKEVHILRGRFLHYMSIIERIMKEYCSLLAEKKTYGQIKPIFIQKLKDNKYDEKEGFQSFVEALEEINPDRNSWAHGFVFYDKRKENKPNNHINLNDELKQITPPYFEDINKSFTMIIRWLQKNNFWEIKGYAISEYEEQIVFKI